MAYIANALTGYLHCKHAVPGADDEWPIDRRGEFPTRYPVIEAV